MARLNAHAKDLLAYEEPLVLLGDYNVIPEARDAANPQNWTGDALFLPQTREAFRTLKWLGLTEAFMAADGAPESYTFWDYQAGAWPKNNGIRIDHALLSPQAADKLMSCVIHRDVRGWDKPSDHVPVVVELDL
jgi:exodeoxyribonuclease-3